MTSATVAGTTSPAVFDGDGKRTSQTVGGVTFPAVYDVNAGLPVLLDDGQRKYVWGAQGLAYTVEVPSGAITVYHADGLGSVRALTDSTGSVVQTYGTDEFGVPDPAQTQGPATQPMQYTGEPRDSTGLVYLRARMYDPATGRFVQRDPFPGLKALPLTLNRFSYVANNPVNLTDPSGLVIQPGLVDVGDTGELGGSRVLKEGNSRYVDDCFRPFGGGIQVNPACLAYEFAVGVQIPMWTPGGPQLATGVAPMAGGPGSGGGGGRDSTKDRIVAEGLTADQAISKYKRGGTRSEFPKELLDKTLDQN